MSDSRADGVDATSGARPPEVGAVFADWPVAEEDWSWIVRQLPSRRDEWRRLHAVQAAHLEGIECFDPQWHD